MENDTKGKRSYSKRCCSPCPEDERLGAYLNALTVLDAGAVPLFYERIKIDVLYQDGVDEIPVRKITASGLQKLLDPKEWLVRCKGDVEWMTVDLVDLRDGLHLEARRLEGQVPLAAQVPDLKSVA